MRKFLPFLVSLMLLAAGNHACRYDPDQFLQPEGDFQGRMLLPIVFGDFTLGSLIDTQNVSLNSDGSYNFIDTIRGVVANAPTVPLFQTQFQYTDTFDLGVDFFSNILPGSGTAQLGDVALIIGVANNTGNSLRFRSLELGSINGVNGNIETFPLGDNVNVAPRQAPGQPTIDTFVYQGQDLANVIANFPRELFFNTEVELQGGNSIDVGGSIEGFAIFRIDTIAILFNNLKIRDTLDVVLDNPGEGEGLFDTLSTDESSAALDTGTMVLRANSTFPTSLNLRLYLLDDQNAVLDSFHDRPEGFSISAYDDVRRRPGPDDTARTLNRIELTKSRAEALTNSSAIRVDADVNTPGTEPAIIYSNSKLDLKLILDASYNLQINP